MNEKRIYKVDENYTGLQIHSWIILEKIKPSGYFYKVKCKCDREFIRNVMTIINGQSHQCFVCTKKKTWFYLK